MPENTQLVVCQLNNLIYELSPVKKKAPERTPVLLDTYESGLFNHNFFNRLLIAINYFKEVNSRSNSG